MPDYEKLYKELKTEQNDQRWREEHEREEAYQRREEERHRRQREADEARLYADTWPEAFSKTLPRLRKEASEEAAMNAESPSDADTYFTEQVAEHEFAQQAYSEETQKIQERIEHIRALMEARIAKVEQIARNRAADRIDEKFGKETQIGENLRNNDLNAVTNW
jgi:hypothetical protein